MAEKATPTFAKRIINGLIHGGLLATILYGVGLLITGAGGAVVPANFSAVLAAAGFTAPIAIEVNKGL